MNDMIGRGGGGGGGGRGGGGGGGRGGWGGHGGGGHGGWGHRGGWGRRVYGGGWGGYGWPATVSYGWPWWQGYAAYAGYPGFGTPDCTQAYAAWQSALRAGANASVTEPLKARFEQCLYGAPASAPQVGKRLFPWLRRR